jgi:hypothetical protein
MKIALVIGVLIASLGGCAIVPVDYGYRGDRAYSHYRGDGYYYGDRYYRGDRSYRSYSYYGYRDHGQ